MKKINVGNFFVGMCSSLVIVGLFIVFIVLIVLLFVNFVYFNI